MFQNNFITAKLVQQNHIFTLTHYNTTSTPQRSTNIHNNNFISTLNNQHENIYLNSTTPHYSFFFEILTHKNFHILRFKLKTHKWHH